MDTTKLEPPYFIPYYILVFVAIVIMTTLTFQTEKKPVQQQEEKKNKLTLQRFYRNPVTWLPILPFRQQKENPLL